MRSLKVNGIELGYTKGMQDKDKIAWGCSRDSNYSVKSAYYFIMDRSIDNSHLCKPGEWDKLRKLKISNKVKVFLWTALCGMLRTRSRNGIVWENCSRSSFEVARRAVDTLQDLRAVHENHSAASDHRRSGGNIRWQKPRGGTLKRNIHAALFLTGNKFGYGIRTMASTALLQLLNNHHIQIKMDCIQVVEAVYNNNHNNIAAGVNK
ncbi:hypothetical protein MTR_4g131250 [Medicago truncatula]|uniref:Reverse transcriptase zinc-binding domain-containing protein n=1 Tax=Medicago truncatula TaxID=3880 RepID=G7JGT8_MEDTR|nr:hypothetical protein MTR_4g131250 [Medicago truncatula]